MQHSDFTTHLCNLNINMQNTQSKLNIYTQTKICLLGCVHQHTNHTQPTLYWTAQTYFVPTLSWYRNSLFFPFAPIQNSMECPHPFMMILKYGPEKHHFVVPQWTRNYSSLCLALHDTISKYPQNKLWYCFVSLFNQKTHELHLCILLKMYSIKLQTSNFLQATHSSTYTLR